MRAEPPAEAADEPAPADEAAQKAEAKEEVKEKLPTAADTIKAAAEVLKNKPLEPLEAEMAAARAADAAEAKSVAKHDAIGKGIIADMYASRAAAKVAAAEAAVKAEDKMVEVLKERQEANLAAEKARQAAAFKAHKAHVLRVKEHYANLEAKAADELATNHAAWKASYGAQRRLPLDTNGETWTANMPDHVVDSGDFWVKAPAPPEQLIKRQQDAEAKAEAAAAPAEAAAAKAPAAAEAPAAEAPAAFL